jgi:hypothetical protein
VLSINLSNYQQTITCNSPLSITNNALSIDLSTYLTSANATSTYQTLSNMSSTYTTNTNLYYNSTYINTTLQTYQLVSVWVII